MILVTTSGVVIILVTTPGVLRPELGTGDVNTDHNLPPGVGGSHQPRRVPGHRPHQESLPRQGNG